MINKFLVFMLVYTLVFPLGLLAKEKRGAELVVQRVDGEQIRGELITVKQATLLLKDSESGVDVSVDTRNIVVIKVIKKSKAGTGFIIGFLGLGGLGAYAAMSPGSYTTPLTALTLGGIGAFIGIVIGATVGTDEIILIEGKSDSEVRAILEKLRKKARVQDYQ
jgi:hypothetical protein